MAVFLTTKLTRENVTKNALISLLLRRGSQKMKTQEKISKQMENLYGAIFECGLDKTGDNQVIKLYIETINDKYLPQSGENMLKTAMDNLLELAFNPYVENDGFSKEYLNQEKNTIKQLIEARTDNKARYSQERCIEEMYKNENYSLFKFGYVDDLENIDEKSLYKYYKELIQDCKIDIFVSGNIDENVNDIEEKNENIQKLNKILIEQSNSEQEYKIAKIYEAFNTTNPRLTNVNVSMSNLNVDPHPNTLGHEVICTKIIDALSTVEQDKKDIAKLTINELKTQNYTGQELRPEVVVKDGNTTLTQDKDYTVSYSQNVEIGEAKVTIIGIGNYSGKVIKTFNIKNKEEKDISNLNISDIQDQIYLGIKVTPDVTIKDGDAELKKNVDYELSYENNIDVGEAKIIIRGVGNYTSSVTKNFKIVAKDIKNVTVQDITDQVYTGTAIEPNVSVMDGSTKLVENKDYTVAYENNVEKGNATIKLAGKGNYTGSIKKEFNIVQETEDTAKDIATLPIDNIENKIYTGKLITPELRIKDGENILEKNKDYTIKYIDNLNVGTATATIKGIGKYKGQVNKTFEIVKKDINYTMILDLPNQTYTGKEIVPQVTIESDGIVLQEGKDYSLKYINNTNVGTATIEIEGTGNYTNKATKTFNIVEISKNNTEQNNENQSENNENANKSNSGLPSRLPKAGISTIIISALFVMIIISVTLYKWLKHNRDIKI